MSDITWVCEMTLSTHSRTAWSLAGHMSVSNHSEFIVVYACVPVKNKINATKVQFLPHSNTHIFYYNDK